MIQATQSVGQPNAPAALRSGAQLGKEEFLQLLVAQLRHQDPMNPTNAQDFAAQLAQFSSVEQLIRMNELMELQTSATGALLETLNGTAAMSALGRTVVLPGDAVTLTGSPADSVSFDLGTAADTRVRVIDEAGETVLTLELGQLGAGRHEIRLGAAAAEVEPGRYRFVVEASAAGGDSVTVRTHTQARIDGLRYSNGVPVFVIGGKEVPLSGILEIRP